MGRRGPAPQPNAEKARRGNPGEHALNSKEPEFQMDDAFIAVAPPGLISDGKLEWERIAPMLVDRGVMFKTDWNVFFRYCAVLDRLGALQKIWDAQLKKLNGPRPDPDIRYDDELIAMFRTNTQLTAVTTQFRHLAQELGLTPSSRSAIHAKYPKGRNAKPGKNAQTRQQQNANNPTGGNAQAAASQTAQGGAAAEGQAESQSTAAAEGEAQTTAQQGGTETEGTAVAGARSPIVSLPAFVRKRTA